MVSEAQALALLEKYHAPPRIVQHCRGVAARVVEIATAINAKGKAHVDVERLKIAGLLHDIGRVRCLAEHGQTESFEHRHEPESVDILRAERLPEIADLVARHGFQSLFLEPSDLSLEEKILIYADFTTERGVCSLNERLIYLREKYSRQDMRTLAAFQGNWHKIQAIEQELKALQA